MCSLSACSSACLAHGKLTLNMPVALTYPSILLRYINVHCQSCTLPKAALHAVRTYHQEVGAGMWKLGLWRKDFGALQVVWQWRAEVGILEVAQILGLGGVRSANLSRFHRQDRLSKSSSGGKLGVCRKFLAESLREAEVRIPHDLECGLAQGADCASWVEAASSRSA